MNKERFVVFGFVSLMHHLGESADNRDDVCFAHFVKELDLN